MSVAAILEHARKAGLKVEVEDSRLAVTGPAEALAEILPELRQHKPEILEALAAKRPPAVDLAEVSSHWLVIQAQQKLEKFFSPPVSRSMLLERFPGAVLLALQDEPQGMRTDQPMDKERRRLVDAVATANGFTAEERAEALEHVLADPENSLRSFRLLAGTTVQTVHGCSSCKHLRRPGTAKGCAGGRDDLPPLHGPSDRLRQLPQDAGATCDKWEPYR